MRNDAWLKWFAAPALLLMGAGAFWDGFYAPAQQLLPLVIAALLAMAMHEGAFFAPLEVAGALFLAAGAGLSLTAPAAYSVAAHGPAIAAGWLLAMVAGRSLAVRGGRAAELALGRFWAVIGTLMAFGGMAAISFTPVHHSGRLASFLGYPVAVGVLGLLGLSGAIPDLAAGRRWAPLFALGNGLAVLLSGSRWVWVTGLLLLAWLARADAGLLKRAMRPALPALGLAVAAALWAAPAVAGRDGRTLTLILLIALLTTLLAPGFQRHRGLVAAGLLAWGAALAFAPGWPWLLGRASALPLTEGSSIERLTFLKDAIPLIRSLPLGAGYRGWNGLHLQAASYGYYSAEVHSAPFDILLAFGWAGGLGFILLLARFAAHLRHGPEWAPERLAALAGLGALALHALLDWDLSYGLFAFPLWFGFGLAAPPGEGRRVTWSAPLTVGLAALALAAAAILGAGDLFTALAEQRLRQGAPEAALRHGSIAVAVAPWNDLSHAYRGQALSQRDLSEQAVASFARARALGPREPWYAQLLARELARQGRLGEAAAAWRDAVALWPWQVPVYEEALQEHIALIQRARGEPALARELARSGAEILAALDRQKAREPVGAPRRPMQVDTPAIARARRQIQQALQE